jgi:archaellum biogenesis ATPase FlaH
MPELLKLSEADPVHETRWLIEPMVPAGELVLLDGTAGVGKTMALCNMAGMLATLKHQKVIFVSSPEQRLARSSFLKRQKVDYTRLGAVEFAPAVQPLDGKQPLHNSFLTFVTETIGEHQPTCIMVDGLDEMLSQGQEADTKLCRDFWHELRELANETGCTILVSRSSGMHESRNYGAFTKTGTDLVRFILTMHWHPEALNKRILNVAKFQFGPIGRQIIIHFEEECPVITCHTGNDDYVKPAKSPQCRTLAHTLGKNAPISQEEARVIGKIDDMKRQGKTDLQVFEFFESNGYARKRIFRLMNHRAHMTMKETKEVNAMYKNIKAGDKLEKEVMQKVG